MPAALHLCEYPLPTGRALRGMAVLVHGLGEHGGRLAPVAAGLQQAGFAVLGYDHYGHGLSPGPRGSLLHPQQLPDDLGRITELARQRWGARTPLLLFGDSMGGLVAAHWALQQQAPAAHTLQGLVLASPALMSHVPRWQRRLVSLLARVQPDLALPNCLPLEQLSSNPATLQDYLSDPLVHDRITARLAAYLFEAGDSVLAQAADWQIPTLLLYADPDGFVDPLGSRLLAQRAPAGLVQPLPCPGYGHEVFNALPAQRAISFATLHDWIDRHF